MEPRSAVGHLVLRDVVRVGSACSLTEAATAMRSNNVSAVLVGEHGAIATERDLARALAQGIRPEDLVITVASPHPVRVAAHMPVLDAAALMLNEEIRHLVVEFDDGREGVVSLRDVVAVLLQASSPHIWLSSLRLAVSAPAEIWIG